MAFARGDGSGAIRVDFGHQAAELAEHAEDRARCLFWEMGVGKSRPTVETLVRWFEAGKITCAIVIAPNGVHRNWISDEIPRHCRVPWVGMDWHSLRSKTKGQREDEKRLMLSWHGAMPWLAISYDGLKTEAGIDFARTFAKRGRFGLAVDEASRIKNPTSKRAKVVQGMSESPFLGVIRVLNGTPVTNSPLDVYAQMRLVDKDYWRRQGIASYTAFTAQFAIIREITVGATKAETAPVERTQSELVLQASPESVDAYEALADFSDFESIESSLPADEAAASKKTGRKVRTIVGYRDLPTLAKMIKHASSRLTKEEAGLNLPPKLYNAIRFELAPRQREAYDKLRKEYMLELDNGALITAAISMVRILRLQQIACGYLPNPDDPDGDPILFPGAGEDDPRMLALLDLVEDMPHKAIIWGRFRLDITRVCAALKAAGRTFVRYDGETSQRDRGPNIDRFRNGDAQYFVANPAAIGMGVTLVEAKSVIYYSNSFSLFERLQSEDRAHRIGQHNPVSYYDLVGLRTVDEMIVKSLRENQEIAAQVTGDSLREWLKL